MFALWWQMMTILAISITKVFQMLNFHPLSIITKEEKIFFEASIFSICDLPIAWRYLRRRGEFAKLNAHHFLGMSPVRTEYHVHAFWHLAWIQSTAVIYGTYNGQRTSEDRVGSYLEEQKCSVCQQRSQAFSLVCACTFAIIDVMIVHFTPCREWWVGVVCPLTHPLSNRPPGSKAQYLLSSYI